MKRMDKQTGKIAAGIPAKYDYMDSLPMEGWAWEFVRRNKKYIDTFSELGKMAPLGVWNDECKKRFSELLTITGPAALLLRGVLKETDIENYLAFISSKEWIPELLARFGVNDNPLFPDLGVYNNPLFISLKKKFENASETVIPKPERRYIDFAKPPRRYPGKKDYTFYHCCPNVNRIDSLGC